MNIRSGEVSIRPVSKETLKVLSVTANLIRDGWTILSTCTVHPTDNMGHGPPVTRYVMSRRITGDAARSFDEYEETVQGEEAKSADF